MHREALERNPSEISRNATSTNASVTYPVKRVAVIVRGYEFNLVKLVNGDVDNLENARMATEVQEVQRGHFKEK